MSHIKKRKTSRQLASVLLLIPLLGAGCAARKINGTPPTGSIGDHDDLPKQGKFSADSAENSAVLHKYIVGQLAYLEEDFDVALENMEQASRSIKEPAPILHARLAELYLRKDRLNKATAEAALASEQEPKNLNSKLLLAGAYAESDHLDDSIGIYRAIVAENPTRTDAQLLLSSLLLKQKKVEESHAVLKAFALREPKNPLALSFLARTEELLGHEREAEALYRKTLELSGERKIGFIDLIRIFIRQGRIAEARSLCEDAQKHVLRDDILASRLKEITEMSDDQRGKAVTELEAIETTSDDPLFVRFRVALLHIEEQDFVGALRELGLVLAKDPENHDARYYMASIFAGSGRRKEATAELWKIPRSSPLFIKSRTFGAFVLRQDQDLKGAEKAIRQALEVEPKNQAIVLYLVLILRDMERFDEAEKVLVTSLEEDGKNEKLLFNLALVLNDLDRDQEALERMEQVLVLNPSNADALNYVSYALANSGGDLTRARTLLDQALKIRPEDGFFLDTLGWIYFREGKLAAAQEVLAKAVASTGEDLVIVEHYVEVLFQNHQEKAAAALVRGILAKDGKELSLDHDRRAALQRMRDRLTSYQSTVSQEDAKSVKSR